MITIKKEDEEITYRKTNTTITFLVNGKKVRVYVYEDYDEMQGSDYDIDEEDKKQLTEEEYEVFQDEDMWELIRKEVGEVVEADGWEE